METGRGSRYRIEYTVIQRGAAQSLNEQEERPGEGWEKMFRESHGALFLRCLLRWPIRSIPLGSMRSRRGPNPTDVV